MAEHKYIDRPPRIQPELPHNKVEIPPPPGEENDISQPIIQIALPLVTIMGYVLISIFGRGRSLLFILPMGISVIASVAYALYNRSQSAKNKGDAKAAYAEQLIEMRKEMNVSHDMQRRFYRHNYPEPQTSLTVAKEAHQAFNNGSSQGAQLGMRLWERRTTDDDFGAVRLGMGTLPSTVVYELNQSGSFDDPQVRDAMRLAEDSQFVSDVPVTIPLRQPPLERVGEEAVMLARHAVGITGKNASAVYAFVRAFLVHYATYHSPTDASLLVLGLAQAKNEWRWVGGLPHSLGKQNEMVCFEDDRDRAGEKEKSKVTLFLRHLRNVLDERKMRLQDPDNNMDVTLPFLLVVVDMLAPLPEGTTLRDLEMDPAISLLMTEGPQLGGAVIYLVPEKSKVPSGCVSVIDVTVTKRENELEANGHQIGFRYAEIGVNTPRYIGHADAIAEQDLLIRFAQQLEPLQVRKSYGADLPNGVLMLDMFGLETAEQLRDYMRDTWAHNKAPEDADWLRVAMGMLSGGDVRRLYFAAHGDGVHGLIAGSTGSGKSELLMTMILGLAMNYDPSIVNFVLVDFKGGAAFEPFRKLPHVVDIVTNLKGSAVERMFAAIMAEIHRREAINVESNSKHIVHYREQGLHLPPFGRAVEVRGGEMVRTAPYPHLFVFIDEFAEMIAENPEYKAQLNSITRLGRALGVTLILAAQRPTGVTDQMRANIKFRIALRVETREESNEVLRRPDAAYLPTGVPGRGYLQVGNENIELIQIAWTGSDYRGGKAEEKPNVVWKDRKKKGRGDEEEEYPKVYEMMVNLMAEMSKEHSFPQRKPWPDFLPDYMTLQTPVDTTYLDLEGLAMIVEKTQGEEWDTLLAARADATRTYTVPLNPAIDRWMNGENAWVGVDWEEKAMRAAVGLIDNPYHSEQLPLVVDFRRGHAVVFGASGWGKTTFLRTLIASLAATHSPAEFHAYILDFGGRQLNVFRDLPHVGAIITPDEEERVTRLLRKLDNTLAQRKNLLSDAGADNLYSYNTANPDKVLPAILVVIDNFAEFRESFENLYPLLIQLVRESRAYGIHFVTTAELPNALGGKMYSLFTERMALKLSDPTEYTGIVGRGARIIDDIPGRGFVKVERRALEFQTALPVGTESDVQQMDETQKLAILVQEMQEERGRIPENLLPAPVDTLATRVLLANVLPEPPQRTPTLRRIQPVLGIDDLTLEPWLFDMPGQGPHCIVVGPPNSGKTTTLRSLVLGLAHAYTPDEVMIVLADFQQRFYKYGGELTLGDLPHVVDVLSGDDQLEVFVRNLQVEARQLTAVNQRKRPIFVIIDNYDSFSEDAHRLRTVLPDLAVLARERGTDGLYFVVAGSPNALRTPEDLRKQIQGPRYSIGQAADMVQLLNGRIPRGLAQAELPIGRAFLVRSGRTNMLQIATPYDDEEHIEATLDEWVRAIQARYPGQKLAWTRQPEEAGGETAVPEPENGAAPGPTPVRANPAPPPAGGAVSAEGRAVVRTTVPNDLDVEELRKLVIASGLPEVVAKLMSKADLYNYAVERKLVAAPDEEAGG